MLKDENALICSLQTAESLLQNNIQSLSSTDQFVGHDNTSTNVCKVTFKDLGI